MSRRRGLRTRRRKGASEPPRPEPFPLPSRLPYATSDQVDNREQEDPDHIHEVPVESDEFHGFMTLFRESTFERLPGDVRHADHAGGHVRAVDARLCVERRAIKRIDVERCALEREVLAEVQMLVLERLDAEERDPEQQGRREEHAEALLISTLDCPQRLDHRQAATDQDEGVDARQRHVQDFAGLGPGASERGSGSRGPEAECPRRADDRREQHDLGREEEPHPQLSGADPRKLRLDCRDGAVEGARRALQVLVDPAAQPPAEYREADEKYWDADGHNSDVADAHPDRDDHGPRAPVMLLCLARGFRVRHLPRTGAVDNPARYNVFALSGPTQLSSASGPMHRARGSGTGRGISTTR